MEDSGAGGKRWFTYLPTGDVSQVVQNADPTIASESAAWTIYTVGTLGRIVKIEKHRNSKTSTCTTAELVDQTTLQYDTPYNGDSARYDSSGNGVLAGRLTAQLGSAATVAFGYDFRGTLVLRDQWIEAGIRHIVSVGYGADGRLLSRTLNSVVPAGTAPYFAAPISYSVGYDSAGQPVQVTSGSTTIWQAGTGASSTDPPTGPYDALGRLIATKLDSGAVSKSYAFYPNSNLPSGYTTTLPVSGGGSLNVYSSQNLTWQGSLRSRYTVTSNWEGGGTSYEAHYDVGGRLRDWSAAALGSVGTATQQFNETYSLDLENLKTVAVTNRLGLTQTSEYAYDTSSATRERVTSIKVQQAAAGDYFGYDQRGRGLVTQHRISETQNPPQDGYEYDVDSRLISISRLGAKLEDLVYGPDGALVARQFSGGSDIARYYVGDYMTLVRRGTIVIGYAHVQLGGQRIASIWSKTTGGVSTTGTIYYHRNDQSSVVATTTNGAQVGVSYRYLPSGALDKDKVVGTEADENTSELGFTGGLRLSSGLIHLKARVYSPLLRRFLQPDTIDPRRYTYARGDPLNYIDPTGRDPCQSALCRKRDGGSIGSYWIVTYYFNSESTTTTTYTSTAVSTTWGSCDSSGNNCSDPRVTTGPTTTWSTSSTNFDMSGLQLPGTGFGQIFGRSFTTGLMSPSKSSREIMSALRRNINQFSTIRAPLGKLNPADSPFTCVSGPDCSEITVGNIYQVDGPLWINPYVMTTEATESLVEFTTMQGHPEAGVIQFSAQDFEAGTVFSINSQGQAATMLNYALYLTAGYDIQTRIWTNFVRNVREFATPTSSPGTVPVPFFIYNY